MACWSSSMIPLAFEGMCSRTFLSYCKGLARSISRPSSLFLLQLVLRCKVNNTCDEEHEERSDHGVLEQQHDLSCI